MVRRREILSAIAVGLSAFSGCTRTQYGNITAGGSDKMTVERHRLYDSIIQFESDGLGRYPLAGVKTITQTEDVDSIPNSHNAFECVDKIKKQYSSYMEQMIPEGKEVTVLADSDNSSLFYVWMDGMTLNEMLLERGYAFIPSDHSFSVRDQFESVLERAKANNRGFWDCRDEEGGTLFDWMDENPESDGSTGYVGDRDCDDFSSQSSAQRAHEDSGGAYGLDGDGDGVACEHLP